MNAVLKLWVSISQRTLLYEVSFLTVQEILHRSVRICRQGVVYLPVSQDETLYFMFQKVLKYADTKSLNFRAEE